MTQFKLIRQREDNGTVDHVLEFFQVGADGRQPHQYAATRANPTTIASDIDQAMRTGALYEAENQRNLRTLITQIMGSKP